MDAHICTVWQFDHAPDPLRVHLKFNGGTTITIRGLAIERAIRREFDNGRVTYLGLLVQDEGKQLSLDRRNGCLWIILPADGNRPRQAVVIQHQRLERLRTAMVKTKHERSGNGNNSNGHG